ncbi:protein of unknown function [Methylocaldum szegediense]|uniref:Uncharacterized protein n=1 Tax=Methylocaldum szegediense TaxID=73780 RepID=A0ABM9I521_9GAMM|nr:protein of unknown function [Methylocaldum szegediense]
MTATRVAGGIDKKDVKAVVLSLFRTGVEEGAFNQVQPEQMVRGRLTTIGMRFLRVVTPAETKKAACMPACSLLILWSWRRDSNPRPADYKSAALPTELRQRLIKFNYIIRAFSDLP